MKKPVVLLLALGVLASAAVFAQARVKLTFSTVSVPADELGHAGR